MNKIRITLGGARKEQYAFRGRTFGPVTETSREELDWSADDWKAAHADPNLAIEVFDEFGNDITKISKRPEETPDLVATRTMPVFSVPK